MARISGRNVNANMSYTTMELACAVTPKVNERTIRRWMANGLRPVPGGQKPFYFHGSEVKAFLADKNAKRSVHLKPHEFWCFHCRLPRKARKGSVKVVGNKKFGICDECGRKICRTNKPAQNDYLIPLFPA